MADIAKTLTRLRQIQPITTAEIADQFIADGVINADKLAETIQLLLTYIDTEGSITGAINRAKTELPINFLKFSTEIVDTSIVNIINFNHEKVVGKLPFATLQLGFIVSRNGVIQEEGKNFTADYQNDQLTFLANDLDLEETITLRCLYYDEPIASPFITFADPEVKRICVNNWGSDGELTYEQAALVTNLGGAFDCWGDTAPTVKITSFNEFQYFTGITELLESPAGNGQFTGNDKLVNIILPTNLITIGKYCFDACGLLTSITIPESVIALGEGAFSSCNGLKSIAIPNSVTSIESSAFSGCTQLESIIFSNAIEYIDSYMCQGNFNLVSITIPNSVTVIKEGAFYNCSKLPSITIPESVTAINAIAFKHCESLTTMTVNCINPPLIQEETFFMTLLENIYVPAQSVEAYKTAQFWSVYAEKITAII